MQRILRALLIAVFIAACIAVGALALGPPPTGLAPGEDKIQHFIAFADLTILGLAAFNRLPGGWVMAGLLGGGIAIEGLQGLAVFHRTMSLGDVIADAGGILAGLILFQVCRRAWTWLSGLMRPG